jgi:hypothetical protein
MKQILRLESAAALVAAVVFYQLSGFNWVLFAACFLLPDLSMLGYMAGPARGALVYNALHNYGAPLILGVACALLGNQTGVAVATIWFAHIAFDRLLGYGLKLSTGFQDTHLGRIGR